MKIINLMVVFALLTIALSFRGEAVVTGGLNSVSESRYYYYDDTAPNMSIITPTGTYTTTSAPILLNVTDKSPLSCTYRLTNLADTPIIPPTAFDCNGESTSPLANGGYIMYVNVSDGKFMVNDTTTFTINYVPTGTFGSSGGGGSGGLTIVQEANATTIIDFGIRQLSITVIAPPVIAQKDILIKNVGSLDVDDAKVTVSSALDEDIDVQFCSISGLCDSTVTLKSGESGFLKVSGSFNKLFQPSEGFIYINADGKIFELKTSTDRLPLHQIIDPSVRFFESYGASREIALFGVFVIFLVLIGAIAGVFAI